jgi:hypothetical protein
MSVSLADLDLKGLDEETGKVPEERLRDASKLRELHSSMREADQGSAGVRAKHQGMLDGEPPYETAVLRATGQGARTNVNWGDAKAVFNAVMTGMLDVNVSVERLFRVPLWERAVPDKEYRTEMENILSDEASKCVRRWEGYDWNFQHLSYHTFGHGVGVGYWDDAFDWRYKTTGLGNFVIPRRTEASEEKIEIASMLVPYKATTLYEKIRNEASAVKSGWNVEAAKKALYQSHGTYKGSAWSQQSWEQLQMAYRNNDLGESGQCSPINVIYSWVREFDGKISIYNTTEQPVDTDSRDKDTPEPWLYRKRGAFQEARNAFVTFCYGIGTNGTYHSISGVLREIYAQVAQINRSQSALVDAVGLMSGVMIQPLNEQSYGRMQITSLGPVTMLPAKEHGEVITHSNPNLASGLQPIISDMRQTISRRTGQFTGDSGFGQAVEKTRFQVQAELEALGKVGATQINLWYPPWERLMRETLRRLCRPGYNEKAPGGREAAEFRRRLAARGFPVELLGQIDFEGMTVERAVGAGSGAARTATLHNLMELAGSLDAVGHHNLIRDLIASSLGGSYDLADRYIKRVGEETPPIDKSIANIENNQMRNGDEVPVEDGQLHIVHLDTHLPFLAQLVQSVQDGAAELISVVTPMTAAWTHCVEHLERVQNDTTLHEKVGLYRQALNTAEEFVHNGQKELAAAQQEAAENGQQGEGGLAPELQQKFYEFQFRLQQIRETAATKAQIEEEKAQQKLTHKAREFEQQAAFKDANNAAGMITQAQNAEQQRRQQAEQAKQRQEEAKKIAAQKVKAAPKKKAS